MTDVPRCRVYSITEETVARHLPADDTCDTWPGVNPDAEQQRFSGVVTDLEGLDLAQEMEGEGRNLTRIQYSINIT